MKEFIIATIFCLFLLLSAPEIGIVIVVISIPLILFLAGKAIYEELLEIKVI